MMARSKTGMLSSKWFQTLAVSAVLLQGSMAFAITPDEAEQAFRGIEQTASATTVQGWGSDAFTVLSVLANDAQRPAFVRARATAAMAHLPQTDAIKSALMRLASAPQQQVLVQRAAFGVLAETYNEIAFVAGFLNQNEFLVREGAVWALAHSSRPAARPILINAMSAPRNATLRSTLELALSELDRALNRAANPPVQVGGNQTGSSSTGSSAGGRPAVSSGRAR